MSKYYRSNHDCFGVPCYTPDGYPIPDEPETDVNKAVSFSAPMSPDEERDLSPE